EREVALRRGRTGRRGHRQQYVPQPVVGQGLAGRPADRGDEGERERLGRVGAEQVGRVRRRCGIVGDVPAAVLAERAAPGLELRRERDVADPGPALWHLEKSAGSRIRRIGEFGRGAPNRRPRDEKHAQPAENLANTGRLPNQPAPTPWRTALIRV